VKVQKMSRPTDLHSLVELVQQKRQLAKAKSAKHTFELHHPPSPARLKANLELQLAGNQLTDGRDSSVHTPPKGLVVGDPDPLFKRKPLPELSHSPSPHLSSSPAPTHQQKALKDSTEGYRLFEEELGRYLASPSNRRYHKENLSAQWIDLANWVRKYQVLHDTNDLSNSAQILLKELVNDQSRVHGDKGSGEESESSVVGLSTVHCALVCTILERVFLAAGAQWTSLQPTLSTVFTSLLRFLYLTPPSKSLNFSNLRSNDPQSLASEVTNYLGKTYFGRLLRVSKRLDDQEEQMMITEKIKAKQMVVMDKVVAHWQTYSLTRVFNAWRQVTVQEKEHKRMQRELLLKTESAQGKESSVQEHIRQLQENLTLAEETQKSLTRKLMALQNELDELRDQNSKLIEENEKLNGELAIQMEKAVLNEERRGLNLGSPRGGTSGGGGGTTSGGNGCPACGAKNRALLTQLTETKIQLQECIAASEASLKIPVSPSPLLGQALAATNRTVISVCRAFLELHSPVSPLSFVNGGATIPAYLNLFETRTGSLIPPEAIEEVRHTKNEDIQAQKFSALIKKYFGFGGTLITAWTEMDHVSVLTKLLVRVQRGAVVIPQALVDLPLMLEQQREYIQALEYLLDPQSQWAQH
jgi:hypothetical protein